MAMFKEKKLMDAEKKWREADFTNRFMFAKIVKDHPDAARDIANLFTEGLKFGDFVYHNAEQILNFSETMKNTVLDFYGVDPVRNVLVQEMENHPGKYLSFRIRCYQADSIHGMLKRGENYEEAGWNVIIFICTQDPFGLDRKINRYEKRIRDTDYLINDKTEEIVIYTKGTKGEVTLEQQAFLDYLNKKEVSGELAEKIDRYVKEAKSDETWKEQFMTLEEYYNEARREGRDEAQLEYLKDFVETVESIAKKPIAGSIEAACQIMNKTHQDYLDAKAFIEEVKNKR